MTESNIKETGNIQNTSGQDSSGNAIFELPSQVDISSATNFCADVKAAYSSNHITFDASKVDRITTPGIQILISATKTAKNRGGKVLISLPSNSFKSIVSDLGFSNQLKEWMGGDV